MQGQAEQIFFVRSVTVLSFNDVNEETWNSGSAYSNYLNSSLFTLFTLDPFIFPYFLEMWDTNHFFLWVLAEICHLA